MNNQLPKDWKWVMLGEVFNQPYEKAVALAPTALYGVALLSGQQYGALVKEE